MAVCAKMGAGPPSFTTFRANSNLEKTRQRPELPDLWRFVKQAKPAGVAVIICYGFFGGVAGLGGGEL